MKRSSSRRLPVTTVLAGLVVAPAAFAQQPADQAQTPPQPDPNQQPTQSQPAQPSGAPAQMTPVTVTGTRPSDDFLPANTSIPRLGGELKDIPQSITIINKALMQSQGATSFQQAIRNVPGVTIGAAEGGTIGNNININGFSARTDLYLDGMRDRGQYYRDVFALEQIEVLYGPSSMLFGRGSTGGVINQVLKKPNRTKAIELDASVTSNGLTRFTADVNQPFEDDKAARVNAMFQRGKATTRDQTNLLDFGFSPSLKLGIGTPTEVTFTALLQHNHDQVDYGVPPLNGFPLNTGRNVAYGFDDDYTNTDTIMLNATVDHKFNKDFKIRNQSQFQWVNTNARETSGNAVGTVTNAGFVAAATPGGTLTPYSGQPLYNLFVRRQSRDRNIDDFTVTNQTEVTANFNTGPIGHTLLGGFELSYDSYRNQTMNRTGSCNGVALAATFVGCVPAGVSTGGTNTLPQTFANLANSQAWGYAPYVNDTMQVLPWLKLVGGGRYDIFSATVGNSINSLNTVGNTTTAYMQQTVTYLSWRAGVIAQPTQEQTYYVSASTSFNPSLEQLTSTTGTTQPLPPENNQSFEAGAKFDLLNQNLSLTGALFQITKNNARTQNTDGTFSATGTIQVKGVRTGIAGRITPEWQVWGGYTYLDARITQGIAANTQNNVPLNTPKDSATLWTTYTFNNKWEIGGGPTYMGMRYANNQNSVQVPEFWRFDATAAYKSEKYDVRLNVFNVFDTQYYEQVIASDGGRAVPGSGLTAMLTLTARM